MLRKSGFFAFLGGFLPFWVCLRIADTTAHVGVFFCDLYRTLKLAFLAARRSSCCLVALTLRQFAAVVGMCARGGNACMS